MSLRTVWISILALSSWAIVGFSQSAGPAISDTQPVRMRPGGSTVFPSQSLDGKLPQSVAFVCDASGSMMEKMPALKQELANAVEALGPNQQFSLTFLQQNKPAALDPNLLPATRENKQKAETFLDNVSTNGSTDPIPGLDLAMGQHPQVMFFLTDGDFPSNQAVLAEIHKLDPDHKITINTIAFVDQADHDTDFLKLLQQIAKESGGTFKKVDSENIDAPATRP